MSSQWPTRRHDIKITRLFIKKHSPKSLEEVDRQNLSPEEHLNAIYPWVPALITRFKHDHKNRDWMVYMLKAIDAVTRPLFKTEKQAAQVSESIVACIRLNVHKLALEDSYDTPKSEQIDQPITTLETA